MISFRFLMERSLALKISGMCVIFARLGGEPGEHIFVEICVFHVLIWVIQATHFTFRLFTFAQSRIEMDTPKSASRS